MIRKWMNRAEWKYCVQELIWGKRGGGGKRREDHPSWLGGSGPGFFSGMIGDHWHSLDTDQSSSVSVRHDWSKKMLVARAQNKIYFTSPAMWGRLLSASITLLHLSIADGQAGFQPQLTIAKKSKKYSFRLNYKNRWSSGLSVYKFSPSFPCSRTTAGSNSLTHGKSESQYLWNGSYCPLYSLVQSYCMFCHYPALKVLLEFGIWRKNRVYQVGSSKSE